MPSSRGIPTKESRIGGGTSSKGVLFDIQRWSLNDGEGIRTILFFKGCPLRCAWCCNPESQSFAPEVALFAEKCVRCGACRKMCPKGVALPALEGGFIDRSRCTGCGKCVLTCIHGARKMMGAEYTAREAVEKVKRDMVFYRASGGGVTFSGGEPTAQPAFLHDLASRCRVLGIDMAIETCGLFDWERVRETIPMMNLVFFDIKHMDSAIHRRHTGAGNEDILKNAKRVSALGVPLVVRVPVIPEVNDSPGNIRSTALFVRENLSSCLGIELLPYHALGLYKYRALGRPYPLKDLKGPSDVKMHSLRKVIHEVKVATISY